MDNLEDLEEESVHQNTNRFCRYCAQSIDPKAKVCPHCSRHQNALINWLTYFHLIPALISIGLLIVTFMQFSEAKKERASADEAKRSAEVALNNVLRAEKDIYEISEVVKEIAEILPRSTGWMAGTTEEDDLKLRKYVDLLNNKLKKAKQKIESKQPSKNQTYN